MRGGPRGARVGGVGGSSTSDLSHSYCAHVSTWGHTWGHIYLWIWRLSPLLAMGAQKLGDVVIECCVGRPTIKARLQRCRGEDRPCDAATQCRGKVAHRILHEGHLGDCFSRGRKLCNLKQKAGGPARPYMGQGDEAARACIIASVLVPL